MFPSVAGGIKYSEVKKDKEARALRQGRLAGERFDYLAAHAASCEEERCKECARWERVCSELLRVWDL